LSELTPIERTFATRRAAGEMAFMPFITVGDPDLDFTVRLIRELAACGADLVEVGFPYSDPIADGPVIQSSYTRALNRGVRVEAILDVLKQAASATQTPLVAMVSFSIVFRFGPERFVQRAAEAGLAGFIVPDLPGDEAEDFFRTVRAANRDLVQLVAPTTPPQRVQKILQCCSGFVYYVSVAGTTGERDRLPEELTDHLKQLRQQTDLPLAVGFGISRPDQVQPLRGLADGVIVGSAIVRRVEKLAAGETSPEEALEEVRRFASSMAEAAHRSGSSS